MSALIIDTNAYSGFLRGVPRAVQALRAAQEIHLPLIVLAELLAGFAAGTRMRKNREELARFMASARVPALLQGSMEQQPGHRAKVSIVAQQAQPMLPRQRSDP